MYYGLEIVEGHPNPPPLLLKSIIIQAKACPLDDLHHPSNIILISPDFYNCRKKSRGIGTMISKYMVAKVLE